MTLMMKILGWSDLEPVVGSHRTLQESLILAFQ